MTTASRLAGALALFASALGLAGTDDLTTHWQDPITKHHYLYLTEARTFPRALKTCDSRMWSLFNPRYLAADEYQRFLASPLWAAVPWRTRFPGEPGELKEVGYWTSSQRWTHRPAAEVRWARKLTVEATTRTWTAFEEQGTFDDGLKLPTICMYRGETWHRCTGVSVCTGPRHSAYEAPELREYFVEEGATEDEARARVAALGTRSLSGTYSDWRCRIETYYCSAVR